MEKDTSENDATSTETNWGTVTEVGNEVERQDHTVVDILTLLDNELWHDFVRADRREFAVAHS